MKNFAKNIVKTIKDRKVFPCSRAKYLLLSGLTMVLFIFSILLGGLMFSIVLHWGFNVEIFSVGNLPYLWLGFFGLFLVVAFIDFKHTKKGYKYGFVKIILSQIVLTGVLGWLLCCFGVAEDFEDYFAQNVPYYRGVEEITKEVWNDVEGGFLIGKIGNVSADDGFLSLVDVGENKWTVDVSNTNFAEVRAQSSERVPCVYIKINGVKTSENTFEAVEAKCWNKRNVR